MNTMTLRQIAELTGKTKRAVEMWAQKACEESSQICEKISQARSNLKPAQFSLEETIAIVRAGGNGLLADLLLQNAKRSEIDSRIHRLPNGKQMEELRLTAGPKALGILCYMIGYSLREQPADAEFARDVLGTLRKDLAQRRLDFDGAQE